MTIEPFKRSRIPFNPAMLRWAREWRGRTLAEAAHKVGKTEDDVADWENPGGRSAPTVRQARRLAELYERPFLEFFGAVPPSMAPIERVPDFRLYPVPPDSRTNREALSVQLWAESQRLNALDLLEALGEPIPSFPPGLSAAISDAVDGAADRARDVLDLPIGRQIEQPASARDQLPGLLRRKLEASGILTLRSSALKDANARGLALAVFPLPVIVIGTESPTAQAFTLVHELGHILLGQSALSGPVPIPREGGSPSVRRVEEWCNRFASAFLIPGRALERHFEVPASPRDTIDDETLSRLAAIFSVSPHAMLIRLVHLKYVKGEYYWNIKRFQFLQQERAYKSHARSAYYGSRYRSNHGDLYTGLVLDAWSAGIITNHNAAEFMGIKNLQHIHEIRERFSP